MNAVQQRPRRWMRSTANSSNNDNNTVNQHEGHDHSYFNELTESRIIYEQPDIRFRPLPFYDKIDDLLKPAGLLSDGIIHRKNDSTVEFKLTIDHADLVAMNPKTMHIILRFCYLDTTSEQDDNFPPDVTVLVNEVIVTLPPAVPNPNKPDIPPKRPGQHVDITKLCKLCPLVRNVIDIKWFVDPTKPSRSYVVTVMVAKKVDTNTLIERILSRGQSDPEATKKLVLDSDTEVATTNLQSSLLCPLGKMRMTLPCKSVNCKHIPCFDALIYLQLNEKKASWICPVCYKPAYFSDLVIDGFFKEILERAASNVTEVTLHSDGSWSPVLKLELPVSAKNPQPEVITISDDDD